MKYARVIGKIAVDVRTESPEGCFTPEIAAQFVEVPDEVENGWSLIDGVWSAPPPPAPQIFIEPEKTVSAEQVRKAMTLGERVKWDNGSTPEIITVKLEFSSPRTVPDATELLDFLKSSGAISQASRDKALS